MHYKKIDKLIIYNRNNDKKPKAMKTYNEINTEIENAKTHLELREFVKDSFSEFNNKIDESTDKLIIYIEQCSVVLEWLPKLNMYQIFINEPVELKMNSIYKKLIQEKIDNIVRSWNPFQEYEENGIEVNHKYWIDNLS